MNWISYLFPQTITKVNSPINGELKVVENFGKKILYADNNEQSGGTITGMWGKAVKSIFNFQLSISNCLILGLGGGTVISLLNKYYPLVSIQVIEYDPIMISIANKYFGIKPSDKLMIINADAFSWIKKNRSKFDLVFFDLYIGMLNPNKARTHEFLNSLRNLLQPNGIILFNAHYQNDEDKYQKLLKDCRRVFPKVELIVSYPFSRILFLGN